MASPAARRTNFTRVEAACRGRETTCNDSPQLTRWSIRKRAHGERDTLPLPPRPRRRLHLCCGKPGRHREPATPRAQPTNTLSGSQLEQINRAVATTGNDPDLDALIIRLHVETACRRGGALALRPRDLDPVNCLIWLREKDQSDMWQPVSPTLMRALLAHGHRGGTPDQRLLRYRNGQPITRRRYEYIWTRVGKHVPCVATLQVTAHWLRHTTLTWVERNFGFAVA
ncbi:tyrosine-type recombinase/integrase [Nocardia tengchongensis]|uniref:tyrosine-type recombinase/integrase n=1 Tax=Nocardia tengchongensis TaxID=2055889 RepID=UPI0036CB475A